MEYSGERKREREGETEKERGANAQPFVPRIYSSLDAAARR